MKRNVLRVLAAGGIAVVLAIASTRGASARRAQAAEPSAAERREMDIAFYAERAARDTMGAFDRTRLAALYLDRARETASFSDLVRAESLARASVRLRESRNASAYVLLAAALMGQHRFMEAMPAAARADELEPGLPAHRALIGEIALEIGDYDRARVIFDSLRHEPLSDVAMLRLARWYEISGRPDLAESRLRAVLADWRRVPDVAPANLAWIYTRLADLALKSTRLEAADSMLVSGLRVAPSDRRLLTTAASLELQRGNAARAIALGKRAIAIADEPATLGVMSDAYALLGEAAKATEFANSMETVARADSALFPDRSWVVWMLDHDRDIPGMLRFASAELEQRKDVYGWDVYAWALHKSGRTQEAKAAMRQALRMGTRDEQLTRHAQAILGR